MSETNQEIVSAQPQPPKKVKFEDQLAAKADEFRQLLPASVPVERFMTVANMAVKLNPDLLDCTPRSLFLAFSKAAQDGLMPDGREGVITKYKTEAQWNPMTYGLRKRARETDGMIIDAQVVYEHDLFQREQGDDPRIVHRPAGLNEDPGPMIGAYAIFKDAHGAVIHREVMRASEIEATHKQSKAPDSLMWKVFTTEAWKKVVIRRGIKTVPVSPSLERAITREDENFDFSQDGARDHIPAVPPPPPPPVQITQQPEPPAVPVPPPPPPKEAVPAEKPKRASRAKKAATPAPAPEPAKTQPAGEVGEIPAFLRREPSAPEGDPRPEPPIEGEEDARPGYPAFVDGCYEELALCLNEKAIEELRDRVTPQLQPDDAKEFKIACADKATDIFTANKKF